MHFSFAELYLGAILRLISHVSMRWELEYFFHMKWKCVSMSIPSNTF